MRRTKDGQLQIRVSAAEKKAIQQAAARAGLDMSGWVRTKLLPPPRETFRRLTTSLASRPDDRRYLLAEFNDFLTGLGAAAFVLAVAEPPPPLPPYLANYVAAMVETAAHRLDAAPPGWTAGVVPLAEPVFGSSLASVRLHLLLASPPAFRRRNIFIDASIGDRV
jgi:hypothetical protein